MQKILLYGDTPENTARIRVAIENQLLYQVCEVYYKASLESQLSSKNFNLVLVECKELDEEALAVIDKLKSLAQALPVLVLTDRVLPQLRGRLNMLLDIHLLIRPVLDKNVVGLVRKLLSSRRVPKQNYRRFNTNQIAHMEALTSGESLMTNMYNLSKGGAYCEFDGRTPLGVGDLYRFKVFLDDTQSEYTFNAKVIWTIGRGRFSGRIGCGLKFVSSKDIYRSMASKA